MTLPRGPRDQHEPDPVLARGGTESTSAVTVGAAMVAAAVFLYVLRPVLFPFAVAGILAYICNPLTHLLAARTRAPRWLFALAILFALAGVAALIGVLGVPPLWRQVVRVVQDLQGTIEGLARALIGDRTLVFAGTAINATQIAAYAVNGLRDSFNEASVAAVAGWSVAGLLGFSVIWVLLAYFLIDAPRIARGLLWVVPPRHRPFAVRIGRQLDPILRRYFVGVLLVVLYAASVAYLGLGFILGLRHAGLLALLTGLLEMLPLIGPATSAILAGLVAVHQASGTWQIVGYLVYAVALRISIDQFVGPIVLGRAARLRPVLIIFCFVTGGILLGVTGVILAVPIALTIKVALAALYDESVSGQ